MKRLAIVSSLIIAALAMPAQNVNFYSTEFAEGVREHLDLEPDSQVSQAWMDTITSINLSGLGIKDIRDVVYLPAVKYLDLSYNELTDIGPLLPLDSLRYVNLSCNRLENINVLALSCADSMEVDIMNNYLSDFSYFFTPTLCQFNLVGMYLQLDKAAMYMDVSHLYCDVNEWGQAVVVYRGYTNAEGAAIIGCNGRRATAQLDGDSHTVTVPGGPSTPAMVTLNIGELGDTTWVLPPKTERIAAGAYIEIETGLPEGYRIGMANSLYGTLEVDSTNLNYTAPADLDRDTVYISYYEGWQLRGFTEYRIINISNLTIGDANDDGDFTISDISALIDYLLTGDASAINMAAADVNFDNDVSISDLSAMIDLLLNIGS